jgi:hypothetical protein
MARKEPNESHWHVNWSRVSHPMGSLHGNQKISTVNKKKTKIQSRKRKDLIYEDRSNKMYERLTLEDPKPYEIRSRG